MTNRPHPQVDPLQQQPVKNLSKKHLQWETTNTTQPPRERNDNINIIDNCQEKVRRDTTKLMIAKKRDRELKKQT